MSNRFPYISFAHFASVVFGDKYGSEFIPLTLALSRRERELSLFTDEVIRETLTDSALHLANEFLDARMLHLHRRLVDDQS